MTAQVGAAWTTDAPFRETAEAIAAAQEAGILAVEMEAAALYAFAAARKQPVLCFAHVTNQMGRIEGDFEKGVADGAEESLNVISQVARRWRDRARRMSIYERWILPPLLDLVMRQRQIEKYRRELIPAARGRVLEVGIGSGLNLPFYAAGVNTVVCVDPSKRLLSMARRRAAQADVPVDLMQGSATAIPLENDSVDMVVMTWTLCSIPVRSPRCARCDGC